jgi:hypothetical protein
LKLNEARNKPKLTKTFREEIILRSQVEVICAKFAFFLQIVSVGMMKKQEETGHRKQSDRRLDADNNTNQNDVVEMRRPHEISPHGNHAMWVDFLTDSGVIVIGSC